MEIKFYEICKLITIFRVDLTRHAGACIKCAELKKFAVPLILCMKKVQVNHSASQLVKMSVKLSVNQSVSQVISNAGVNSCFTCSFFVV